MGLRKLRKGLAVLLTATMLVGMMPDMGITKVSAAQTNESTESKIVGAFTVTGGTSGTDYEYADGVLTITSDTPITIANTYPNVATTDRIEVADSVSADITLAGVNIDVSSYCEKNESEENVYFAAFKIVDDSTGDVTITLADDSENTLESGDNCAGLQKNGGVSTGTLTIQGGTKGTGKLAAKSGYGYCAGIGGANEEGSGSNITISGGTVSAKGIGGAGIGGVNEGGSGSYITINGGTVSAIGLDGAGIGGGSMGGSGSNITISGGTVSAIGLAGAGIGGGELGSGSNITISGGTVTATGGNNAAGIGGGELGSGSNITISGGTVTATGGNNGAGIGGGVLGSGSDIKISGGSVKASGANAIGGGDGCDAITPTSDGTTPVYLLTIANLDSKEVLIDGVSYKPVNHKAVDKDDTNLYAYLPAKTVTEPNVVKLGTETTRYIYDSKWRIVAPGEYDGNGFCNNYEWKDGSLLLKDGIADGDHTDCNGYQPATLTRDKYDINGDGTKDEVYEISNAGQLYWFADKVNNDNANYGNANAVLTANITVNSDLLKSLTFDNGEVTNGNSFRSWTPIGWYDSDNSKAYKYSGTFDGNNKTISGFYFNETSTSYIGLFGYVGSGGSISNVTVTDSYFNGKINVGGVCGKNQGTITNCHNTGEVSGTGENVGGVCGSNTNGTIENCSNTGKVSGKVWCIGGVCGYNYACDGTATIKNCNNAGEVSSTKMDVGGVCGLNEVENGTATIENCQNTGKVSSTNSKVGGVCGYNYGTIKNCNSEAEVSGGNQFTGGVCGSNIKGGTITNCYNKGRVNGSSTTGGVCGSNDEGTIKNCNNTGEVSGTTEYIGGVCGSNIAYSGPATITNCYNTGAVSGRSDATNSKVGGVCGYNYACYGTATIENCYNTGAVSGRSDATNSNVGGVCGLNDVSPIGTGAATSENCYYLSGTSTGGINGSDVTNSAEVKSTEKFASGEVCYLLNGSSSENPVWYQNIDLDGATADEYPVLDKSHETVYQCSICTAVYSNTQGKEAAHSYKEDANGNTHTCEKCGDTKEHSTSTYLYIADAENHSVTAHCADYCGKTYGTVTLNAPDSNNLTYNGSEKAATLSGAVTGVTISDSDITYKQGETTLTSAPVNAGTYTASITLGDATVSVVYTIEKAIWKALCGNVANESIRGKADGKWKIIIADNDTDAERKAKLEYKLKSEDDSKYKEVSGTSIENLAAGTYYIRRKEDDNHKPDYTSSVWFTIDHGRYLTVTMPAVTLEQDGYEVSCAALSAKNYNLEWHEGYSFAINVNEKEYHRGSNYKVFVNNKEIQETDGVYVVPGSSVETDQTVEVQGVEKHTCVYETSESKDSIIEKCSECNKEISTVTITAPEAPVYDGTAKEATIAGALMHSQDTIEIKYARYKDDTETYESLGTAKPINPGKYQASITLEGKTATVTYEIDKASLKNYVTVVPYEGAYDGSGHGISVTVSETAPDSNDEAVIRYRTNEEENYSDKNPSFTDVGTYTVYYKVSKNNYYDFEGESKVVIDKASLKNYVTVVPYEGVYDGGGHGISLTVSETAPDSNDEAVIQYRTNEEENYSAKKPSFTNAGTYTVYYKVSKNNYYNLEGESKVVITQKPVTVTAEDKTKTYGQENPAFTFTVPDGALLASDTKEDLAVVLNCLATASSPVTAEGYAITGTSDSVNYNVTVTPGTLTINKADARINVGTTSYDKTFGDADFPLEGISHSNTEANVQYEVTTGNDVVSVSNGTVTILKAGTAIITVSLLASTNYNAAVNKTITVNVAKKSGYAGDNVIKNYTYLRENADTIDLSGYLPANCGAVTYGTPQTSGTVNYTVTPAIVDGKLSYTVEKGSVGDTGSVKVDVSTGNYEDFTITVNVKLIDQLPVSLKEGSSVTLQNSTLTYGEALSTLIFDSAVFVDNEGNEVAGTLAWKTADSKPTVGTTSATWVFTPNDNAYADLEDTIAITVKKATPQITELPTVADRTYNPNVSLTNDELIGGSVSVGGSWSWQSEDIIPTVNNSGYVAVFTPTDSTNYETVNRTITVTVNKAASAPNKPDSTMNVDYSKKKVSDITSLPEGWAWQDADKDTALKVGTAVKATAVYTGEDKGNYETESVEISITRADCTHATTQVKDAKDATCTEKGYTGDTCCTVCGAKIASGREIPEKGHSWDSGVVTKEATETEDGERTYTCTVCGGTKTEGIPKKATATPEPTATATATSEPTATATATVTVTPEPTATATPEPTATATPTATVTPEPTATATPEPTATATPEPTATATPIPTATATPEPTPTATATVTATPEPLKKGDVLVDDKASAVVEVRDVKKKEVVYEKAADKKAKTITIPATVKISGVSYKVTKIKDNAFKNNKTLTKITVGSNIKCIGKNAFYKCTKLENIKIGKNVTEIGSNAFKGCKKLKTIKITSTKLTSKTLAKNAFKGLTKATIIKVPKKKLSAYKKLFKRKGLSSKVKVKGY